MSRASIIEILLWIQTPFSMIVRFKNSRCWNLNSDTCGWYGEEEGERAEHKSEKATQI